MSAGKVRAVLVSLLLLFAARPACGDADNALLVESYLRLLMARQLPGQVEEAMRGMSFEDTAQANAYVGKLVSARVAALRGDLTEQFGADARSRFEAFVADFTEAEGRGDGAMLETLAADLELAPPVPRTYGELKRRLADERLDADISAAAEILSQIETWADLKSRGMDVPSVDMWLNRAASGARGQAVPQKAREEQDPLRASEPSMAEGGADHVEMSNPMASFEGSRKARRDRVMDEAHAGMKQVADERKVADEEYAARKLAAAQAEAEAMKRHAESLAATEKQAADERSRSWGNRLKKLAATTAGAAAGAFTGGLGARAGQEAVDALFGDSSGK